MPPEVPGKAASPGDTTLSPTEPTPEEEEKRGSISTVIQFDAQWEWKLNEIEWIDIWWIILKTHKFQILIPICGVDYYWFNSNILLNVSFLSMPVSY